MLGTVLVEASLHEVGFELAGDDGLCNVVLACVVKNAVPEAVFEYGRCSADFEVVWEDGIEHAVVEVVGCAVGGAFKDAFGTHM